jgi:hypothetical protein
MTLEISLSAEAESRLLERAAAAGKDPADFVRALLERDMRRPTLEEISGPVYQEFLNSGLTDDQLAELLEETKHAMRAEKHGRNGQ